jgi:LysR family hydrogen peroxide-inducible transcriptional activator
MLTPLGKEIATRARRLLVDAEELVGLARNAQEPLSGPLRFGIIPTVGPYVLPSLLPHLGTALPKLKLYLREAPTPVELSPKVGDGGNRKGGISWGCLTPPLLHQRSDMPCPKITSSS